MSFPPYGPFTFQVGTKAAAAVTGTTPVTGNLVMTTTQEFRGLTVFNSLNNGVGIAFMNPAIVACSTTATEVFRVNTTGPLLDLAAGNVNIPKGTAIYVYALGSVPTTGEISITMFGRDLRGVGTGP